MTRAGLMAGDGGLRRLRGHLARRLVRVLLGEQGEDRAIGAGQAGAGEQGGAGLVQLGAQEGAGVEAGRGEVAVAPRAEAETGQGDKALSFIFHGHGGRFSCELPWQ